MQSSKKSLGRGNEKQFEAVQFYNAKRIGLGDEFRDEAWKTIRLAWHPLGGSIRRCSPAPKTKILVQPIEK